MVFIDTVGHWELYAQAFKAVPNEWVGNGRSHTHVHTHVRPPDAQDDTNLTDRQNFRWTPSITGQSNLQYGPYPIPYATAEVLAYYTVSHRRRPTMLRNVPLLCGA